MTRSERFPYSEHPPPSKSDLYWLEVGVQELNRRVGGVGGDGVVEKDQAWLGGAEFVCVRSE